MTASISLQRYKVLLAGIFSQLLCVGVARFAYTPLLPVMQGDGLLNDAEGGWLAAFNYAGYMLGAVLAASTGSLALKDTLYRAGLLLAVVTTLGMALTENVWLWAVFRFLAGLSSSASMLLASGLILHWLIEHKRRSELGIHFAGLGLGIVLAALAVEGLLALSIDWRGQWLWLTALGAGLVIPAWRWLPPPTKPAASATRQPAAKRSASATFLRLMVPAYFCAGYGYVVNATFLVTIVEREPLLAGTGNWAFALVGLSAALTVVMWDFVARHLGYLGALCLAMAIQVVGIWLPLWSTSLAALLLSAVLYGGTFLGCVCLVLTMAGRLYPDNPARLMGQLTLAYGAAQIIAPAVTGMLAEAVGDYRLGLWLAGALVALGAVILLVLKRVDRTAQRLDTEARAL
ncbi:MULTISPECIES: YbfB/YjiJ family MFS transporter [unclassified Halomonas]|uniref:YbfB/YjiJ family MFS transporter n=1 Tax=unclassified Halomonas TaxID=2609666 RepID=UPI002076AF45|nr:MULTISPECIES: YbfB/YjiJ family MFS transporter [unclassified Halomonas]